MSIGNFKCRPKAREHPDRESLRMFPTSFLVPSRIARGDDEFLPTIFFGTKYALEFQVLFMYLLSNFMIANPSISCISSVHLMYIHLALRFNIPVIFIASCHPPIPLSCRPKYKLLLIWKSPAFTRLPSACPTFSVFNLS